ncbi:hypothetical protein B0H65DRAFT_580926 [Neurospora tetraspora]|uniref:Uncharacterized protein n=1 Tax=Neurospora tetraspora TaxID=94610 RepID=A0AAE0MP78_9PEZI|nr:hypothetical protein B0H65DRAFT_580926 [Neurospora tetraspora]
MGPPPRASQWRGCAEHGTDPYRLYVATAVHKDCFVIAKQSCPLAPRLACERIWELAVARSLWLYALSLRSLYLISLQAVNQVASIINIPQLINFSSELVERIRSYLPGNALFWRAVAALTVASSLPDLPISAEQRVEIRHILHWERGEEIATIGPRGQHDVLRLTFDVDGIREIERFCQQPQCEDWQMNNRRFAYALLDTKRDEFSRRFVYCRNGLLRLLLDADDKYYDHDHDMDIPFLPRVWDTPTPPDLTMSNNLFHHELFEVFSTGHYVSLDSISGLIFVYRGKELVAIHPHRGDDVEMDCPKTSASGSSRVQEACFFLPVTKEDTILGIGVGDYQNAFVVVVKKRLSGETVIGLPCLEPPEDNFNWEGPDEDEEDFFDKRDFMWGQRDPVALVYGFLGKRKYLDLLGGYRGTRLAKPKWEGWRGTIPHLWPSGLFSLDDEEDLRFYTRAPLRGVVAAQMFFYPSHPKRPKQRVCSGIIFHYDNGGSRVVGEIRLEDRAKLAGDMIINPKLICLECEILPGFDTPNIHFVTESEIESEAHPDEAGWSFDDCPQFPGIAMTCHPMRGIINWWFTARQRNSIEIHEWADEVSED